MIEHSPQILASHQKATRLLFVVAFFNVLLTASCHPGTKSGVGSPDRSVTMFDNHFRRILWMWCPGHIRVCPGHIRVKGNNRVETLAGEATITIMACVSEDLKF